MDLAATPTGTLTELLVAEGTRVVVNAAGGVWGVDGQRMVESNVDIPRRMVAALSTLPWQPRLIQLGSMHEYGPVRPGQSINELIPCRPTTAYGQTKLDGTGVVLAAAAQGLVDAVVLRIANVVGPGAPTGSLLGAVAAQLAAARGGEPAVLRLAPLRAKRDFLDVRDTAAAVLAASRAPVGGRVFNIGAGQAVGVRWLVERLVSVSGVPARIVEAAVDQARAGGAEWQRVDIRAARESLGWQPIRTIEESLDELWAAACTDLSAHAVTHS
jgi:dTDP-6-deoxy-L-talose 4-dehydrogenase [NAD(P)+]